MNRFRSFAIGAVVTGLIAAGVAVQAQGPRPGPRFGRGGPVAGGLPLRGLDLTDTQRQLVREVQERHRDAQRAARQQLRQAMMAQRTAAAKLPVDESLIRSTSQALAEAQTAVAIAAAQVRSEIFDILTPEQKEKLQQQRERGRRGQTP